MKIGRLVSIIMLLLDKNRLSAQELARLFEVSVRTIYRDVDAINEAGIPVYATPGVGGGFEIMEKYKVDKKVFSADDLSAILQGLSGLSNAMSGDALAGALAKVKSFIPAESAQEIELKASQIYIDLSPWMGNENARAYLEIVKTALRESKPLSFDYADRYGNKTARVAEPHQLVLKGNHWYVQAYCRARADFRLFKLSRMSNPRTTDERFTPREFQKPRLDFPDAVAPQRTSVTLRVHESIRERVLEYCAEERLSPDGNGHYLASFPFIENDYHYDILLGFGNKCECVAPPRIRAEVKRRIRELATLYEIELTANRAVVLEAEAAP